MAAPDHPDARRGVRTMILIVGLVLLVLFLVIVFRGCFTSNVDDDHLDPPDNDPFSMVTLVPEPSTAA